MKKILISIIVAFIFLPSVSQAFSLGDVLSNAAEQYTRTVVQGKINSSERKSEAQHEYKRQTDEIQFRCRDRAMRIQQGNSRRKQEELNRLKAQCNSELRRVSYQYAENQKETTYEEHRRQEYAKNNSIEQAASRALSQIFNGN
jgi:hypothetical protein